MAKPKKQDVTVTTVETRTYAAPTLEGVKQKLGPAVSQAAHVARDRSNEYAHAAGDWAKPKLAQGKAMTGPALASAQQAASAAAHALSPVVEEAKGRVEQALPSVTERINAALAAGNAARAEVLARGADAALVLAGDATIKRKKEKKSGGVVGNMLAAAGILAAAGAVAGYLARRSRDREDPWAQPLADPYVAPSTGRESTVDVPITPPAGAPLAAASDVDDSSAVSEASVDEATTLPDAEGTPPAEVDSTQVIDLTDGGLPPSEEKKD